MNTTHESESAQDFEALYLAYKAKYEIAMRLLRGEIEFRQADITEENSHD